MSEQLLAIKFVQAAAATKDLPQDGKPEIALAGRSNVGKSSLINALSGQNRLAKVSGTPGKTQLLLSFLVNETYYITDLPGYGYSASRQARESFSPLTDQYFQAERPLCLTLLILDSRHLPSQDDRQMLHWLQHNGFPFALVFTKADKLSRAQLQKQMKINLAALELSGEPEVFVISNTHGHGLGDLADYLNQVAAEFDS